MILFQKQNNLNQISFLGEVDEEESDTEYSKYQYQNINVKSLIDYIFVSDEFMT